MTFDSPTDAIAAVTHRDPYPYYAKLVNQTPLYRDESLSLWIASSADAVNAVLTNELCKVRPPTEPVPKALLGSPAADIFRQLIRMNDGGGHCPFNRAVAATLATPDPVHVAERATQIVSALLGQFDVTKDLSYVSDVAFKLAPHVIAGLLGVPNEHLDQTSRWVGDFVRCVFPSSTPEQIERGKVAAENLHKLFNEVFDQGMREHSRNLLVILAQEAERVGRADRNTIVANGIGFLSQAYEATSGLIGNALLALAAHEDARRDVVANEKWLSAFIQEVLRFDPPGQNTRRFLAADGEVFGQQMKFGEAILVITAAANRDPKLNSHPAHFDLHRTNRKLLSFGAGMHACPGIAFATIIAQAGVSAFLRAGLDVTRLKGNFTYRASGNARVPLFANGSVAHE